MAKNQLTLTNNDLKHLENENKEILDLNKQIVKMRKRSLAHSLMESTKVRTSIVKKIHNWIELLEDRLFDPVVIKELDINKVMSLLKIVTLYSIKIFNQVNQMENIMKGYLQTEQMVQSFDRATHTEDDEFELKKKLTKSFVEILTRSAENITPTANDKSNETNDNSIIPVEVIKTDGNNGSEENDENVDIEKDDPDGLELLNEIDGILQQDKLKS